MKIIWEIITCYMYLFLVRRVLIWLHCILSAMMDWLPWLSLVQISNCKTIQIYIKFIFMLFSFTPVLIDLLLHRLGIHGACRVTSEGASTLFCHCKQLKFLDLSYCTTIQESLQHLPDHLQVSLYTIWCAICSILLDYTG